MNIEICVKCKLRYCVKKIAVVVNQTANFGSYKLWEADLKECPKCKHQIISGFASYLFSEHYQENHTKFYVKALQKNIVFDWNEK